MLDAVRRSAIEAGHQIAASTAPRAAGQSRCTLSEVAHVLALRGYEPHVHEDTIVLSNCPFHTLARGHTELVCGLNLDLITAMLQHLGVHDLQAGLDPAPHRCCVTLTTPDG